MAIGDLYQARFWGLYKGEACWNTLWYTMIAGTATNPSQALSNIVEGRIIADARPLQMIDFIWQQITVINWSNPTDNYVSPFLGLTGAVDNSDGMPSYITYSFEKVRPYPGLKSGRIAFSGVPELNVSGNFYVGSEMQITNLASQIAGTWSELGATFQPCVLRTQENKQPLNTAMGNPPFNTWALGQVLFNGISTQLTRKP